MQAGAKFNRFEVLALAVRFGCTAASIRFDVQMLTRDGEPPEPDGKEPLAPEGPQWDRLCLEVLTRDKCRCHYCGCEAFAVDHVVPRAANGGDEISNLVTACLPCNTRKGRHTLNLFNPVLRAR